jgi:zinc transport system substrate-binding protein
MRIRIAPALAAMAALAALIPAAAGCSAAADGKSGKLNLVVAFYPIQYLAERIAGDHATVTNLTKPGVEPHDLELTAEQSGQISDADLLIYLKGLQPAVDDDAEHHLKDSSHGFDIAGVNGVKPLIDVGDEPGVEGANGIDPHIWLDPVRYAAIGEALAHRLEQLDPDHRADYAKRAEALGSDLEKLGSDYSDGLANCKQHKIVTSHAAFGYIAKRYHLVQVAITGVSPEQEPTAKRLAEIARYAKAHHVKVIFFETLVSPKLAETLAKEVGAQAKVLDPIEGLEPGSKDTYLTVMRRNLSELRSALVCS